MIPENLIKIKDIRWKYNETDDEFNMRLLYIYDNDEEFQRSRGKIYGRKSEPVSVSRQLSGVNISANTRRDTEGSPSSGEGNSDDKNKPKKEKEAQKPIVVHSSLTYRKTPESLANPNIAPVIDPQFGSDNFSNRNALDESACSIYQVETPFRRASKLSARPCDELPAPLTESQTITAVSFALKAYHDHPYLNIAQNLIDTIAYARAWHGDGSARQMWNQGIHFSIYQRCQSCRKLSIYGILNEYMLLFGNILLITSIPVPDTGRAPNP